MKLSHIILGFSSHDEYLSNLRRKTALPWVFISKQRERGVFCCAILGGWGSVTGPRRKC